MPYRAVSVCSFNLHDGFRILARRDAKGVRLYTGQGHDLSKRFPRVVAALASLPARFCPWVSAYRERPVEHLQLKQHSHGACPETIALLLYTAQRRSDVDRMGRKHVRGDVVDVRQQKTGKFIPIPMHPELARILTATPAAITPTENWRQRELHHLDQRPQRYARNQDLRASRQQGEDGD
jgi:hypothetical protein